jgi:hypothetical protein
MIANVTERPMPRIVDARESVPGLMIEYSSEGSIILKGEEFGQNVATGEGYVSFLFEGDIMLARVRVQAGDTAYDVAKKLEEIVDRSFLSMDVTRLRGDAASMTVYPDNILFDGFEA